MSDTLRMWALFPPPQPKTERGKLLYAAMTIRAHSSWIKPGSYAWWIHKDLLERAQQRLVEFRKQRIVRP